MKCTYCGAELKEGDAFCGECGKPIPREAVETPPLVEKEEVGVVPNLADFGTRFAAYLIDIIIIDFVSVLLAFSVFFEDEEAALGAMIILMVIIGIPYFIYFFGTTGQTPGKQLMKIKVVTVDGSPLTYGIGFMRWIGYQVSGLTLGIGFLWILRDKNKQGFEDKIAGTYVVKA